MERNLDSYFTPDTQNSVPERLHIWMWNVKQNFEEKSSKHIHDLRLDKHVLNKIQNKTETPQTNNKEKIGILDYEFFFIKRHH